MVDWTAFLNLVKQYGPTVAALSIIIYWQWRQIDKLLERNSALYEKHIQFLYETQSRLLTKILGPQPSSQTSPTMEYLKKATTETGGAENKKPEVGREGTS